MNDQAFVDMTDDRWFSFYNNWRLLTDSPLSSKFYELKYKGYSANSFLMDKINKSAAFHYLNTSLLADFFVKKEVKVILTRFSELGTDKKYYVDSYS